MAKLGRDIDKEVAVESEGNERGQTVLSCSIGCLLIDACGH